VFKITEITLENYNGLLTDRLILEAIKKKKIIIEPFPLDKVNLNNSSTWPRELRSSSYVFTLGRDYAVIKQNVKFLDGNESIERHIEWHQINGELVLSPGECIHARTKEKIGLAEDISGNIDGLKQNAEKFVTAHTTSGTWNPGDGGSQDPHGPYQMLLEMKNYGPKPVVLRVGQPICKMQFFKLPEPVTRPYYKINFAKAKR